MSNCLILLKNYTGKQRSKNTEKKVQQTIEGWNHQHQ